MVENASVPTGEQTVQLLRSMSTYINSSMHLKENQIAKDALSKLALEQRADHKIVNKLTKDVEHIKLQNGMYRQLIRSLEKQLATTNSRLGIPQTTRHSYIDRISAVLDREERY